MLNYQKLHAWVFGALDIWECSCFLHFAPKSRLLWSYMALVVTETGVNKQVKVSFIKMILN